MNTLHIRDVRAEMPNYAAYASTATDRPITGIAIHHSAQVNPILGFSISNAAQIFRYHVKMLGWEHGGYHYVVHASGRIEYALDEGIAAYHAGFKDSADEMNLEHGQYWNNHYLAICALGWFDTDRTLTSADGQAKRIPNRFVVPTKRQMDALITLIRHLKLKYRIPCEHIRGHRELDGCITACPGANLDMDNLRGQLC